MFCGPEGLRIIRLSTSDMTFRTCVTYNSAGHGFRVRMQASVIHPGVTSTAPIIYTTVTLARTSHLGSHRLITMTSHIHYLCVHQSSSHCCAMSDVYTAKAYTLEQAHVQITKLSDAADIRK